MNLRETVKYVIGRMNARTRSVDNIPADAVWAWKELLENALAEDQKLPSVESLQKIINQQNEERLRINAENKRNYDQLAAWFKRPECAECFETKGSRTCLGH